MNYLIGTKYRGSLIGHSELAKWHVFEKTSHSILEQIKSVHVYGLGDCQGALYITYQDEVYNIGFNSFVSSSRNCTSQLNEPLKIEGLSHRKIAKISVGLHYGIALSRSGTLYHWGRPVDEVNAYGRLSGEGNNHSPHQLAGFCHVAKEIACGESFFAVLTDNRQVFVTGWIHWEGKFYDKCPVSPDQVDISSISCGAQHLAMVAVDGTVYTCGWGGDGQLGYPWTENYGYRSTRKVQIPEPCTQTACGHSSTIFLTRSGSIWACGWNDNFSKLGVSSDEVIVVTPQKVQLQGQFKEIASSYWATCSIYAALKADESTVFKWGNGCWSTSCEPIPNSSIIEAFIDFPTPPNLGFSEQPTDDFIISKHIDTDFDWNCLTASDILFDYLSPKTGEEPSTNCENAEKLKLEHYQTNPPSEIGSLSVSQSGSFHSDNLAPAGLNTVEIANYMRYSLNLCSLNIVFHSMMLVRLAPFLTYVRIRLKVVIFCAILTQIFLLSVLMINTKMNRSVNMSHSVITDDYLDSDPMDLSEYYFVELVGNARFSDVTFLLANGEIPGHKSILYSRSMYFQQLLNKNESLSIIDVHQFTVRVFQHFLKYMYIRRVDDLLNIETLIDLMELARKFEETNFHRHTICKIRTKINQYNLVYVIKKAKENGSKELRQVGLEFINQLTNKENFVIDLIEYFATDCV